MSKWLCGEPARHSLVALPHYPSATSLLAPLLPACLPPCLPSSACQHLISSHLC